MSNAVNTQVNYAEAARRHLKDAEALYTSGRRANAGQLFGFAAECGLKALLIACKVPAGPDGGLPQVHPTKPDRKHPLREHVPRLMDRIAQHGQLIPDGASATRYMARLPGLMHFNNWSIDHRYWRETALPLASVTDWRVAASEVGTMLDQAKQDGVLS
jgi:hypothetical protein